MSICAILLLCLFHQAVASEFKQYLKDILKEFIPQ